MNPDLAARMRALERLRAVEGTISMRVAVLRRWLLADIARHWQECGLPGSPPPFPRGDRVELWWRAPRGGGPPEADRGTLDRIPILAEWLASLDGNIADAARPGHRPRRYSPGRGEGTPLRSLLERLFLDLWRAESLREEAGIDSR